MKIHAITTLATPLLALAISAAASSMALAQDDAVTEPEQLERSTTPNPDDADLDRDAAQTADTDCVDIPDAAPQQNAQGTNSPTDSNAQAARASENGNAAANPNAQVAQNRDDCLDLRTDAPETDN